jgi:DNA-binding transcriptional ArsR family regulator
MQTVREVENITKALANRRRLSILKHLRSVGNANVGDIAKEIKLSFAATSRHLRILSATNVIEGEQIGLIVNYHIKVPVHRITKSALDSF